VHYPTAIYNPCLILLRQCTQFASAYSLAALFVTHELTPFRDGLPDADSKEDRITKVVA
jgi:hypothetical protein